MKYLYFIGLFFSVLDFTGLYAAERTVLELKDYGQARSRIVFKRDQLVDPVSRKLSFRSECFFSDVWASYNRTDYKFDRQSEYYLVKKVIDTQWIMLFFETIGEADPASFVLNCSFGPDNQSAKISQVELATDHLISFR